MQLIEVKQKDMKTDHPKLLKRLILKNVPVNGTLALARFGETMQSTRFPYLLLPCLGLRCLSRWFLRSPGPEDEAEDEPDPPGPVDDTSWLIISHMSYCSDSMSLELSLSEPWARSSSSMNPLLHRGQTYSC